MLEVVDLQHQPEEEGEEAVVAEADVQDKARPVGALKMTKNWE